MVRFFNKRGYKITKEGKIKCHHKCCFSEIMYMEIFLEVSDTEIQLKSIEDKI
jgi:hypothetical protein